MKAYRDFVKGILGDLADLSLNHGPVEIAITEEDEDGDLAPAIILKTAPDGVLRGLLEDDRIADLSLEYGELRILPAPEGLEAAFVCDNYPGAAPVFQPAERGKREAQGDNQ